LSHDRRSTRLTSVLLQRDSHLVVRLGASPPSFDAIQQQIQGELELQLIVAAVPSRASSCASCSCASARGGRGKIDVAADESHGYGYCD
jgi:hypothetical protein